ncbi:MAG: type II 3-dehydroquinate dehydratase [Panacagrimonas sp.]
MSHLLLINGPNLNLLGKREPQIYGQASLAQIEADLRQRAKQLGHALDCFQSNHEGALVDRVQQSAGKIDFILLNAGALTHTSIALRDALLGVDIAFIEVHLSNVFRREAFRHQSHFSDIAVGVIVGLGPMGYNLALHAADHHLKQRAQPGTH